MKIEDKELSFMEKIDFIDQELAKLNAGFCLGENNTKFRYDYALVNKLYSILSKPNPSLYKIYELCGIENNLRIKDDFSEGPLFIRSIKINRQLIEESSNLDYDEYPFSIPIIHDLDEVTFNKPVTFFIGGNGIGKSTLLEALAVKLDIPAEGGTKNYKFSTHDTHSCLYQFINTVSGYARAKETFFFRAETFYNFATEYENINDDAYHSCSHGESFMRLAKGRFKDKSLYILDEPEAALSFDSQLQLLVVINDLIKEGSQFIIATHSPILLSLPNADILNLEDGFNKVNYKDTKIYMNYRSFLNNTEGFLHYLLEEDD